MKKDRRPNPNKCATVTQDTFTTYYCDTQKHYQYPYNYEQPLLPYLQNLQLYGDNCNGKQYQQHDATMTQYQEREYREALYGLEIYKKKELASMSPEQKASITEKHRRAQRELNLWKQELISEAADKFLLALFPNSQMVKGLVKKTQGYKTNKKQCNASFKELHLSKQDIFKRLTEKRVISMHPQRKAA